MRQGQTKLRVNDQVEVITGKDKGRVGKVMKIDHRTNKVIVERVNMIVKHSKPVDASQPGQRIEKEAPFQLSNVKLICPECADKVRIGLKLLEDGTKVRVCKKCGATIETNTK